MQRDVDAEAIEVSLFLEAVHVRYGYDLREYAPKSMRRRVLAAGALGDAKQGVCSGEHLAAARDAYAASGGTADLSDYYSAAYDRIAMRDSLRKNVLFFQHNLVSDHVFGEMQVVFCRNVLIY